MAGHAIPATLVFRGSVQGRSNKYNVQDNWGIGEVPVNCLEKSLVNIGQLSKFKLKREDRSYN